MGGGDHPQGAAGWGGGGFLGALPVGHQPHQELVGPGYSQGRRHPLSPDTETENSRLSCAVCGTAGPATPALGRPTHPGGPAAAPRSSANSVTWRVQIGVSGGEDPAPLASPSPGAEGGPPG